MFSMAGLAAAAGLVNFVVLTAAASSANSGIYSTSRMLYALSQDGDAPQKFSKLSATQVPRNALLFSCIFLLAAVVLLYAGDSVAQAFTLVTTVSALCFMFVWSMILISYLAFRKRRPQLHDASKFKVPGGMGAPYMVLAFFVFVLWALTTQADTRAALLATPLWFLVVGMFYLKVRKSDGHRALRAAHRAKVRAENEAAAIHRRS